MSVMIRNGEMLHACETRHDPRDASVADARCVTRTRAEMTLACREQALQIADGETRMGIFPSAW